MISSSTWVPRGYASEFPEQYELDDAEMDRINEMAKLKLSDAREDLKQQTLQDQVENDDDMKAFNLESYDDDDDASDGEDVTMFPGLSKDVKFHEGKDGEDPYLSLPTENDLQEAKQELQVYPTDNLVLATRTEDDISYLDVYVYDDGAGAPDGVDEEGDKLDPDAAKGMVRESNLYVHHDIMLPAFPLCVEWMNVRPGSEDVGNFAAVGTFDPQIEIWNLDCIDKAFPDAILGEPSNGGIKKKKKKSKGGHVSSHHTDAVLSLSHNKTHRLVLASTSADHTIKLWDLNHSVAARSLHEVHNDKTVSLSQWHSAEALILLTGGYDGYAAVTDVRIESADMSRKYKVGSGEEVENVCWGPGASELFYAGTDTGNVYCFDIRNNSRPVWTLHAHDAGISSLNVNAHAPGMIATSAMGEKVVKLWRATADSPSMVLSRDFGVGNVLTTSFASDIEVAGNLVVGGVSGALKLWDAFSNSAVRTSFRGELKDLQTRAKEEAAKTGRASRIARKYRGDAEENVMTVESTMDDESDEDEDEE